MRLVLPVRRDRDEVPERAHADLQAALGDKHRGLGKTVVARHPALDDAGLDLVGGDVVEVSGEADTVVDGEVDKH